MELNAGKNPPDPCTHSVPENAGEQSVRLRPHHLLCTQGYSGTGYDNNFKAHTDEIVHRLRTEEHTPVTLVFSTDELCSACPNRLGEDHCRTNEKVKAFDRKTVECFHLEEKSYIYQDVVDKIHQMATPEIMDYICGDCSWYPISACRERVLGLCP